MNNTTLPPAINGKRAGSNPYHLTVEPNSAALIAKLECFRIKLSEKKKPRPVVFSINQAGMNIPIVSLGAISVITGKAKSRKSTLAYYLTAKALGSTSEFCSSTLPSEDEVCFHLQANKRGILLIDTEQSDFEIDSAIRRTCLSAGLPDDQDPEHLLPYGLVDSSPMERLELTELALSNQPNIGLVIIDGIRDYVRDITSSDQADEVISRLLKWKKRYNCHIMVVLHENKYSDKMRGHLGTELEAKAETVFRVSLCNGGKSSLVEAGATRARPFAPFVLTVGPDNLPAIDHSYQGKDNRQSNAPKQPKRLISDYNHLEHCQHLKNAFQGDDNIRWKELEPRIKDTYPNIHKESARRDGLRYLREAGYLATNSGAERNKSKIVYWLTDKAKEHHLTIDKGG